MRNLWLISFFFLGSCAWSNQALKDEIETLKQEQETLRKQLSESEQKVDRMETALENSLQTVLGNKKNIGLIYNIIKQLVHTLIDDKGRRLEDLKAILKITDQMTEANREPER